jgi:hypothetical protein
MPTDESEDPFIALTEAFIQTQGSSSAVYHILIELVIRLAAGQADPSGFLKSMYESISAKLDQTPFETEQKRSSAEMRETLATFFSVSEKAVRRRTQGNAGPSIPPK